MKKDKPRLMTIEEAAKAEVCYVEYVYDNKVYPAFVTYQKMDHSPDIFMIAIKGGQAYKRPERINKDFRFWTAKPNDKLRLHTAWEV